MSTLSTRARGYTLLELIVSVGIFSIVMLAATGAYLGLIQLDRQARAVNDVVDNLSFAVDSMSRSIRTGTNYKCNNDSVTPVCTGSPGHSFGFNDSDSPSRSVVYRLSNGQIVADITPTGGSLVTYPLTDPRITVDRLDFYVRGVGLGDGAEPQVTFTMHGSMSTGASSVAGATRTTSFSIQGGATQRYLEL